MRSCIKGRGREEVEIEVEVERWAKWSGADAWRMEERRKEGGRRQYLCACQDFQARIHQKDVLLESGVMKGCLVGNELSPRVWKTELPQKKRLRQRWIQQRSMAGTATTGISDTIICEMIRLFNNGVI